MKLKIEDLRDPKKFEEYLNYFQQCLTTEPRNRDVYIGLATLFSIHQEYEAAETFANIAIGLDPLYGGSYVPLSQIYLSQNRIDEAINILEHASKLNPHNPSIRWNLSMAQLQVHNFKEGWSNYQYRKVHLPGHRRFISNEWDGSYLGKDKTLLVWSEQGLGDQIMFFRFLKDVKEKSGAEKIIFEVNPEAYMLFRNNCNLELTDMVYQATGDGNCPYKFDTYCSLCDLPALLGIERLDEHKSEPYLIPNPVIMNTWTMSFIEAEIHDKPKIGICWAGSPRHPNDINRSAELKDFIPLKSLDVTLVSLVKDRPGEVPDELQKEILDVSNGFDSLDFTAGCISHLDCVVTVDTAIAHLAGAMGKKTYLLLPWSSEWRWGIVDKYGQDTYWYDSVKLYRQETPGSWKEPLEAIIEDVTHNLARNN